MSPICRLGLHRWVYEPNTDRHGNCAGRSMLRHCSRCGRQQGWDLCIARVKGVIVWKNLSGGAA